MAVSSAPRLDGPERSGVHGPLWGSWGRRHTRDPHSARWERPPGRVRRRNVDTERLDVYRGVAFEEHERHTHLVWDARLQEFKESPVVGIGFARTRYGRISTEGDYIEPGSSYLAILSMTGLAGGIGWFVLFGAFGAAYVRDAASVPKLDRLLIAAVAAFFGVHLAFEGYIYAPGSLIGLIFYAWLATAWDTVEQGVRKPRIARPSRAIDQRPHSAATRVLPQPALTSTSVAYPTEVLR